jgi:hypothetical protein
MGKSRNLLSHSSVLHNDEGTPTLSRCLWDDHAPSYNCNIDTMTAGEIRTLAKTLKGNFDGVRVRLQHKLAIADNVKGHHPE